ncbi:MAG: hypothetical protein AAF907_12365, partial [Planctomycetota bacterium]
RARRAAIERLAVLSVELLEEEFGEGLDASRLAEWVRTVGDDWSADLFAAFYHAAAQPGGIRNASFDSADEISRRYQLKVPDPREDPDGAADAGRNFGRRLLATHVDFEGEPLSGAKLDEAVSLLGLHGSNNAPMFELLWNREGDVEQIYRLFADFFGPLGLQSNHESVIYRHRMPGTLLETSGTILSLGEGRLTAREDGEPAEMLFRFEQHEAWPFGKAMTARSVVLHPEKQRELFGEVLVGDRSAAIEFLHSISRDYQDRTWQKAWKERNVAVLRKLLKN